MTGKRRRAYLLMARAAFEVEFAGSHLTGVGCMQFCSWARCITVFLCVALLTACGGGGAASNQAPLASFTASVLGTSPGAMRFNASASADPDGEVVGYAWDFGDGQAGQGREADHDYAVSGSFLVTLVVTDSGGATASVSQTIEVLAAETLSGTITAATGMMADADSNDPAAPYTSNDTPDMAQAIANPVLLGGYANLPFAGPAGPSFEAGDVSDFFRLDLAAGQTITLNIADHVSGDLDLYLYHDDGSVDISNPDYGSFGTGQTELLSIASSGSYFVEVYVFRGYSNYNLVVGQETLPAGVETLSLNQEFVPGEVIVQMKQGASARSFQTGDVTSMGLQAKAGAAGRPMLLKLADTPLQRQAALRSLMGAAAPRRNFRAQDQTRQLKFETLQAIKALRQRKDVLYAEPNYIQRPLKIPLDAEYGKQWHYRMINLPTAWDASTGSAAVIVAVVDTGVLLNHPDLNGQFSADGGYDFILNDQSSNDNEPGIDANPDDPGDSSYGDSSFHGTHVAGTVAARTNFVSVSPGVAGVAPGVKIMPLRVLGANGGTLYDINQALLYAAGLANDSGTLPAQKAAVINLSLGGGGYSQMSQNVYTQVRAAGSVVVAAAGNEASSLPSYPASYDGVISVSAVDLNANLAPYSNFGSRIDVAAPGGNTGRDDNGDGNPDGVLSTAGDDSSGSIVHNYKFYQGTSMAAPHVAGVIALMKSVYSDLSPGQVDNLLAAGNLSRDIGATGRDDSFGYGLIDAARAVSAAQGLASGGGVLPARLQVVPEALNLGFSGTMAQLSLSNGGDGDLTISSVGSSVAWLTLAAATVDPVTQLGVYDLTLDRTNLAVGTYQATLTIVSSVNTVTVPVILQVADMSLVNDAGYQYVLLIDSSSNGVIDTQSGSFVNGALDYTFQNVPFHTGQRYIILSGSDMDNDGLICDAGESCGAYLALDLPVAITPDNDLTGLDFLSGFEVPLSSPSRSVVSPKLKQPR